MNSDGSLAGFNINNGTITIGANGLSHTGSYVDLMANAIKISGQITADTVRVTGGGFDYDYSTGNTTSHGDMPGLLDLLSPSYSIDVAKLGGIKARQIQLVGSAYGFGVRNAGNILAQDTLVVNSMGVLENTGTLSSTGNATFVGMQNMTNGGQINAGKNLTIMSYSNLNNTGTITARKAVVYFMGNELTNSGIITANQAQIASVDARMAVAKGKISNNGTIDTQVARLYGGEMTQSSSGSC